MTAPFDEAAARKQATSGKWWVEFRKGSYEVIEPQVRCDRIVATFMFEADARACVEAHNGSGEPVAWQWRLRQGINRSEWSNSLDSEAACRTRAELHVREGQDVEVRPLYTAPQPAPPGAFPNLPAGAIPPEGLAAAQAALERFEARKAVPADEWAAQVAGAFVKLGSDAESLGTRRVDPAAAVDAVRIVERMRDAYDRAAHDCRNHFDARGAFLNKLHAADEILAALRGEAR